MGKYSWSKQQDERREERRPKPVKKFTYIANESKKRAKENRIYSTVTRPMVLAANPICQILVKCFGAKATQVHHTKGRIGNLLNDIRYLLTGCNDCHDWAEKHPKEAKELGISLSRLNK